MNKKLLPVILALILILSVVFAISGCNKDEEVGYIPNELTDVTPETEESEEEPSVEKPSESESQISEKETDKATESTTEKKTEPDESQTEKPTINDKPATCDICGGIIVDNSDTDLPLVGNYCDGKCDEWYGEFE
ncbi:MAG: hypothetical protein IJZ16_05595 [Clostridia bacterium]|nr:hypothetical protein [Clostridia bacterium]